MRIYPDPELPDVSVEWLTDDCRNGDETVTLTIDGVDSPSHLEVTVPCTDIKAPFNDVKRERFHIAGHLRDATGGDISDATYDVDLRDGLDEDAFLYFGAFDDFRVAWTFEGGATCSSLGALEVQISFGDQFAFTYPCDVSSANGNAPDGDFSVVLTAYDGNGPVAQSAPQDVTIDSMQFTNLGTFTLLPLP